MPFTLVIVFFKYLERWAREGLEIELCSRCLFFLLKIHQLQIVATKAMRNDLLSLQKHCRNRFGSHGPHFVHNISPSLASAVEMIKISVLHTHTHTHTHTHNRIKQEKDIIGFNKAAMTYVKQQIELNTSTSFFADAAAKLVEIKNKKKNKNKKRKRAAAK